MSTKHMATGSMAALLVGLSLGTPAVAQDIFTTEDYRQDRALWTDPAYYRNNTPGQLRGQAFNFASVGDEGGQIGNSRVYGSEGTAQPSPAGELLKSPYPYASAWEHYQAWLEEADGGTQHTKDTIPDWSGRWMGGGGLGSGRSPPSDIIRFLQPEYQVSYIQELHAVIEGRIWGAGTFCFPRGFFGALSPTEWIVTPERTWTLGESNTGNTIRWIYTDDSGHTPENFQFSKWHGESIGFWDGDALIVHTNQIKGWDGGPSEFSDQLEAVERYRRVGDVIEGEITVYDPVVYTRPLHGTMRFRLDPETNIALSRMFLNSCTDTNGPSTKVYLDERGINNERLPGEPFYFNAADLRPWVTYLTESDRRYEAYLAAGGTPHHALNEHPDGTPD